MKEDKRELLLEFSTSDNHNVEVLIMTYLEMAQKRVHEVFFVDGLGFFTLVYYKSSNCYHMDCYLFSKDEFTIKAFFNFLKKIKSDIKKKSNKTKNFINNTSFAFLNYIDGEYSKLNKENESILSYSISVDDLNYTHEEIQALGYWLVKKLNETLKYIETENVTIDDFPNFFIKSVISNLIFLNAYYENLYEELSLDDLILEKISFLDYIKEEKEKNQFISPGVPTREYDNRVQAVDFNNNEDLPF